MFDRILICLDGSDEARRAGELGLQLAKRFGSQVTALFVADVRVVEGPAIEALAPMWGEVSGAPFQPEVLRAFQARGSKELETFAARARALAAPVPVNQLEIGIAEESIVGEAARADLVVLGRRGEHARFGVEALGTTVTRVLRRSPHPVLIGDGVKVAPSRPLVAYDGSEPSVHALDLAIRFATESEAELRVVFAGHPSDDSVIDTARAVIEDHGIPFKGARIDAEPTEAIGRAIERWRADCVFMGAFGHTRIHDLLFGSHTLAILEAIPLPLFIVR